MSSVWERYIIAQALHHQICMLQVSDEYLDLLRFQQLP